MSEPSLPVLSTGKKTVPRCFHDGLDHVFWGHLFSKRFWIALLKGLSKHFPNPPMLIKSWAQFGIRVKYISLLAAGCKGQGGFLVPAVGTGLTVGSQILIFNRLHAKLDQYQFPDQAGFRKQFHSTDHLMTCRLVAQKSREWRTDMWVAAIDVQKAFDSTLRNLSISDGGGE